MGDQRTWLDVPYSEKDEAKAHGARWDPAAKRWYAPQPNTHSLHRWAALPDLPTLLPGEDRAAGDGLFVDLVPASCWFTNVRSCVTQRDWERLRRMILGRAGHRCEVCGRGEDRAVRRWLEVHERWSYDDVGGVQALRRLICLCTDCHSTTHFGLAQLKGTDSAALAHLCAVTGMSMRQALAHVDDAFALWRARSLRSWSLDLAPLTTAGVTLAQPPDPLSRAAEAARALRDLR